MGATTKVNVCGVVCVIFTVWTSAGSSSGLSVHFSRPAQCWHTWLSFCFGLVFASSNTFCHCSLSFLLRSSCTIGNGFWWGFSIRPQKSLCLSRTFPVSRLSCFCGLLFSTFFKVFLKGLSFAVETVFLLVLYLLHFDGVSVDFTDIALNGWSTAWIAFLMVAEVAKLAQLTELAQLAKLAGLSVCLPVCLPASWDHSVRSSKIIVMKLNDSH